MRKFILISSVVSLLTMSVFSGMGLAASKIFKQPITIVCSFSPGGGTDLVDRALAEGMKQYLGVPVNVVNMPGNNGGTATEFVWLKPRDGYNILGASETNLFLPANGGHSTTTKDWEYFMAGGSPGVILVPTDSPYKTFKEVIAAAKANPSKIKVASGVSGGLWHTKWALIAKTAGIKVDVLPMNGSKPSLTAGVAGDVDIIHVSLGEALPYINQKQLRALCMSELKPYTIPEFGEIPAIVNVLPTLKKVFPLPMWLGLAVPANTPKPILNELNQAFQAAMKSQVVTNLLKEQVATPYGYSGKKAKNVAQDLEAKFCWTLYDLGTAKHNPADLKIARPKNI